MNFWSAKPIAAHQATATFFGTTQHLTEVISHSAIPVRGDREVVRGVPGKDFSCGQPQCVDASGGIASVTANQ